MGLGLKKRAISGIVSTVLIIMIAVATVGVIGAIVVPMIRNNLAGGASCSLALGDIYLDVESGFSCFDSEKGILVLRVARGSADVLYGGAKILVFSEGNSYPFRINSSSSSSSKVVYLNVSRFDSIEKVELSPIVLVGSSEKQCGIGSSIVVGSCDLKSESVKEVINEENLVEEGSGGGDSGEGEEGTKEHPFKISNCNQFQNINNNLSASYELVSDIDCSSIANFVPISVYATDPFTGTFEGNGFTISNINMNYPSTNNFGVFSYIYNSSFDNFKIRNSIINGGAALGGVFSYASGSNITRVQNINVSLTGKYDIGGFIRAINSTAGSGIVYINQSSVSGTVKNTVSGSYGSNAGFIARVGNNLRIDQCYADVSQSTVDAANGGFYAWMNDITTAVINNSYSNGTIVGNTGYTGGFGGPSNALKRVYNSYTVKTGTGLGTCFNHIYSNTPNVNSFYDKSICTRGGAGGAVGKTTAEMKTLSTFLNAGWSIATKENYNGEIWYMDGGYPKLAWENSWTELKI